VKYLILSVLLFLTGCYQNTVYNKHIERAEAACEPHGGLLKINSSNYNVFSDALDFTVSYTCMNGMEGSNHWLLKKAESND
jgi:hypothetical protein